MDRLKGRADYEELQGDKWDSCCMCGSLEYGVVLHFNSGSVAPTDGETVTGATSGDTGVIVDSVLTSGTYAGGDAAGVIFLYQPTGYDQYNLSIFSDGENVNGSTSGSNFATVNGIHGVYKTGRRHPDTNLIEYRGKKYCREHFAFRFKQEWLDDAKLNLNENERGK